MPQISTTSQILASLPASSSSSSSASSSSTPSSSPNAISENTKPPPPAFPGQDCLACKIVGSGAFTGLGVYSLYQAYNQGAFKRYRPPGAPVVSGKITAVLGTVFLGLGIGRLFI